MWNKYERTLEHLVLQEGKKFSKNDGEIQKVGGARLKGPPLTKSETI